MHDKIYQESHPAQFDTLSPDELENILSTVDSMITDEYYPMDEAEDSPLYRSVLIDSPNEKDKSEDPYYIAQYRGDDEFLVVGIPGAEDSFVHISQNGQIEIEQDEPLEPIEDKKQYVLDLMAEIKQAQEHEVAIQQVGQEFASVYETAEIGEPIYLESEESQAVLDMVDFSGELSDNLIDKDMLTGLGLEPAVRMDLTENITLYMSRPYFYGKRNYVVALLGYGEEVVPRIYYQSLSQSTWRYLPGLGKDGHHSKSGTEDGLNLPLEVQITLGELSKDQSVSVDQGIASKIITGITGSPNHSEQSGLSGINPLKPEIIGDSMVSPDIFVDNGPQKAVCQPEDVVFSPEMEEKYPDFGTIDILTQEAESSQYGTLTKYRVSSVDGQWQYVFAHDEAGRSWLTMAEDLTAPINKLGLRTSHPSLGVLTSPAYEYDSQAGGFGGESLAGTRYVDIYEKLLSRFKIIQDFEAQLSSGRF